MQKMAVLPFEVSHQFKNGASSTSYSFFNCNKAYPLRPFQPSSHSIPFANRWVIMYSLILLYTCKYKLRGTDMSRLSIVDSLCSVLVLTLLCSGEYFQSFKFSCFQLLCSCTQTVLSYQRSLFRLCSLYY